MLAVRTESRDSGLGRRLKLAQRDDALNRGIELIGAARAGQSMHLMPVFGSVMALLFLRENFRIYHAVGISLIAAGILLASWKTAPILAPQRDPRP